MARTTNGGAGAGPAMALRFGAFELDLARYELHREGTPVPLQPRLFDLLAYLIGHRDAVVTRDELLDGVWNGVHVSDAALTQAVAALRRALADGGADPVIQTVRGRGYRFVAPVEAAETEPGAPATRFVGRDALLRELEALVDAALAGQPSVVFLWGEPGIGKTRPGEEIAQGQGTRARYGENSRMNSCIPPLSPQ